MTYADLSTKFRKFFELPTSPVAVKILREKKEHADKNAPMRFCEMVRLSAVYGESFIADLGT